MAKIFRSATKASKTGKKKKTSIGSSAFTKSYNKGGGPNGSTTSKNYKKKQRGQGCRRRR
tara:strand:- start:1549 stop:1728 length:180 start_codon:yes stop_codon:yes gene_type:complete